MSLRRWILATAFVLGCGKTLKPPQPAVDDAAALVEAARERATPARVRARFHVQVASTALDLAGSTGGGLVLDRPGRARMDLFGPLGSPVVQLAADGEAVQVLLLRQQLHYYALDAEEAVRGSTGGAVGLDTLLGVVVGDLPFDDAEARSWARLPEGGVRLVLDGPEGSTVEAVVDPAWRAPERLEARGADGTVLLRAAYGGWQPLADGGVLVPDEVALYLPGLDLSLDLRFRRWEPLDEVGDVFHPEVPDGFVSVPLEAALAEMATDHREVVEP